MEKNLVLTEDELEVLMSALSTRVVKIDSLVEDWRSVSDDDGVRTYQRYVAESDLLHQLLMRVIRTAGV